MNSHPVDLDTGLGGDGGLGEELRPAPPYRRQALKRRAIAVAARSEPRIAVRNVYAFRIDRRPHRQIHRGLRGGYSKCALGVQQPLRIGLIAARIHRHRAAAGVASDPDHHLHLHSGARLHHQRRGQQQLVDDGAADLITGADGQFQKASPGKQHDSAHRVIGQPGLSRQR